MNKLQKKVATALATSALLMQMLPGVAFAGVTCTISENGSDTENTCDFASLREVTVTQDNDLDVDNEVEVKSTTGDNEAEDNTGGDVEIETGGVEAEVTVETTGNTNAANVEGTSSDWDYTLQINGNGTDSDNKIDLDVTDSVTVDQDNDADVDNEVKVDAETGDNEAEDNTGGDVSIKTGDVKIVDDGIMISSALNANSAVVGVSSGAGALSAWISNNGSDSDNEIDLALLSEVGIEQDNDADVDNEVEVDASTGDNEAEDNTGGDSMIETGDVEVDITVDTMANFNQADVAGSVMGDVELKVKGNGTDSDNVLDLDLTDALDVDQDNDLDVDNKDIEVDADTGDNELEDNTLGEDGDDPAILTGGTDTSIGVSTSGNANVFGGEMDLELDFDLSELVRLLSALSALLGL